MNVDSITSGLQGTDISGTTALDVIRKRVHLEIKERADELLRDVRNNMKPNRSESVGMLV